jgi:hypothetical protein
MLSRENRVLVGFVAVALGLTYGGFFLTDLSTEILVGILVVVGVVAPQLINGYLDRRDT